MLSPIHTDLKAPIIHLKEKLAFSVIGSSRSNEI